MKPASMAAVAAEAGVAKSTVSRFISGNLNVGIETENRIRAAIEHVGYKLKVVNNNEIGHHRLVAVVVADLGNAYYSAFAEQSLRLIETAGYSPVLLSLNTSSTSSLHGIEALITTGLHGAISIGSESPDHFRALLRRHKIPLVTVEEEPRASESKDDIELDNYSGARQAVTYLTRLGHRDIAFISGPRELAPVAARRAGYVDGLRAEGIDPRGQFDLHGECSEAFGFTALTELLSFSGQRPTAAFVAADEIAIGVLNAASHMNLDVPADLSIVGFDDIPAASHVTPRLTTVNAPLARLAESAAARLLRTIAGDNSAPHKLVVPVSLVVRESSAALGLP